MYGRPRVAGLFGISANWSGAGMYTPFDCGPFMPLCLMSPLIRSQTGRRAFKRHPLIGLADPGSTVRHHTISTSPIPASSVSFQSEAVASKRLPVVINAQTIRAIFFAKATASTLYGFFTRSSAAQRVGATLALRLKRSTACAPTTRSRRR